MKARFLTWLILLPMVTIFIGCNQQLPSEESCNFVQNQNGRRVSWARMPIEFYAHESLTVEQMYLVDEAMDAWNQVFDSPVFIMRGIAQNLPDVKTYKSGEHAGKVVPDNFNGIYVAPSDVFENVLGRNEQARTSFHHRGDWIFEADILIDASEDFFRPNEYQASGELKEESASLNKLDFKSLMIHELGHVLGLDHIEEGDSVMSSTLGYGEVRTQISDADIASLECEYN